MPKLQRLGRASHALRNRSESEGAETLRARRRKADAIRADRRAPRRRVKRLRGARRIVGSRKQGRISQLFGAGRAGRREQH
ncbi:hypothetical protein HMPREF0972_00334 [Actinomyces sp. oral taxon 848 str. F0332]|nr:hypothetical protein HMPREF0972_00334 [Actinomyces sp. oral taxon 848 str. F0332]